MIGISGVEQMIFVTVGTHEQQFDRLIEEVDRLKGNGIIEDEVVVQTGFCTYEPRNCRWSRWFSYKEICGYVKDAEIVITHGGPASFIAALRIGKIPIVVPRQKRFGEHVNDHQLEFCREVKKKLGNIILVEETEEIGKEIENYRGTAEKSIQYGVQNGNSRFNAEFKRIVEEMNLK